METNKRELVKTIGTIVVGTIASSFVTKTMLANFPSTDRFKIAQMTGAVAGWWVQQQAEPYIAKAVDDFFDKRQTSKN